MSKIHTSAFGINIITLITGTTIAQIIAIIASPIITRLYSPDMFGLLALFTSITSIMSVICCLRYEFAIVLPDTDEEAVNVFGLCLLILLFFCVSSVLFLFLVKTPLIEFLNVPQISPLLWLIPPSILLGGLFLALNYWNTRRKNYNQLSLARVSSSCAITGTQLGMGFFGNASGNVLIGATIIGQIISSLVLITQIIRYDYLFFKKNITLNKMINALKRYQNFPKYDIWSALLNSISWQIPIFLLSYYFSTTIVGFYSLGMMMIHLPMNIISSAISQVFFQRAAEMRCDNTLNQVTGTVFRFLFKFSIFPALIMLLIGKEIFTTIFGTQWAIAGIYVQILSLWALLWFISSPLSSLIAIFEKQSWGLFLNIIIFSTRVISLVIGGILESVELALLLFSVSGFITYGYLSVKLMEYSKVEISIIFKIVATASTHIFPIAVILIVLKYLQITPLIIIIFAFGLGLVYYCYLIKTEPQLRVMLTKYLAKTDLKFLK